jgi:hypothetical protein
LIEAKKEDTNTMGCDGGTIPRRVEMVRLAKKQPKLDDETSSRIRWQVCSISEQPLVEPIVTDDLGNVMNREAVLEALVNKSLGKRFKHIKSLKVRSPQKHWCGLRGWPNFSWFYFAVFSSLSRKFRCLLHTRRIL